MKYIKSNTSFLKVFENEEQVSTQEYPRPTMCPHCSSKDIVKTTNDVIYGKIYGNGDMLLCNSCRAYTGYHDNGKLGGMLSNEAMRTLKKECHSLLDQYWKSRQFNRMACYGYLAKELGIFARECHIGWLDEEYLYKAIRILKKTKTTDIDKYIKERKKRKNTKTKKESKI